MPAGTQNQRSAIETADEELLASLGYKQEFQRAFTGLEVSTKLESELNDGNMHCTRLLE